MTVDAGDVFVGGRYHSLVPILREVYRRRDGSGLGSVDFYHSLAVVKKGTLSHVETMEQLQGARACFPGVGHLAGWTMPVQRLMEEDVMKVVDCNNHVKSASEFFGPSCAVNSLQDRYNPLGDNSHHLCELCGSFEPGVQCTSRDPFAGEQGALTCLMERGEVAFLGEKALQEGTGYDKDDFELLCPVKSDAAGYSGTTFLLRRPIDAVIFL